MGSSSDQHYDGVVSFGVAGDARVSANKKEVDEMASDGGISRVLKNGGNDVGKMHAINLVVDLRKCFTKESNNVKFTEKNLPMASFKPAKIIQCAQDLAKDPFGMSFLEVLTMGGNISAFNHWKRNYQLHRDKILNGKDEKLNYGNSEELRKTENGNDCSRKRKEMFDIVLSPTKKVKCLSDLMSKGSHVSDVEYKPKNRGRKRKTLEFNRDEFLSRIYMAAINPIQKHQNLDSLVRFSSEFRNYRVDQTEEMEIQPEIIEEQGITGIKDSYWSDRIIELKPKKDDSATDLILKFTNLKSVPSVKIMNEIFGRYGCLLEHETKVLKKKKCVKMVFERRCDAETAFSSSGKFSIFGPNLVSYCLNFSPTPRKRGTAGRNQTNKSMKLVKRKLFEDLGS